MCLGRSQDFIETLSGIAQMREMKVGVVRDGLKHYRPACGGRTPAMVRLQNKSIPFPIIHQPAITSTPGALEQVTNTHLKSEN